MDCKNNDITNYILTKKENNELIELKDPNDIAFSNIAQNATVTGATLPSGLKIPNDGIWKIYSTMIIKNFQIDASLGQSSNVSETNLGCPS